MTMITLLKPRTHDLGGGMMVRRVLPAMGRQSVGPFVFFDHFGPMTVRPEDRLDVRPHPHIGLSTVSYLFEGAIVHRDSLGVVQRIEPGAINWMTAGRGIVHSERRPEDLSSAAYTSHGLQLWAALPRDLEDTEPSFAHTPAPALPEVRVGAASVRVLVGAAFGRTSPVATVIPTLYLDVRAEPGSHLTLDAEAEQRAVYAVDHALSVDGVNVEPHTMAILAGGTAPVIGASDGARYVIIGGQALDGHRHIWWNFVSSRRERIEEAKRAWEAQSMGTIPGETDRIPLPG